MTMKLTVYLDGGHKTASAAISISGLYADAFEPMRTNDHPLMCLMEPGSTTRASQVFEAKHKLREDAAKILSEELAKVIINQMESGDTHNGYRSTRND